MIYALLSAIAWGCGDFFIALSSKKFGAWTSFFVTRLFAVILLLLPSAYFIQVTRFTVQNFLYAFLFSFLFSTSVLLFFKSLEGTKATINGAIASSFSVVSILISVLYLGEKPSSFQSLVILIVVLGVFLTALDIKNISEIHIVDITTIYALLAMFMWGFYFVAVKIISIELGWFWPVFFSRLAAILFVPLILRKKMKLERNILTLKSSFILLITSILPTLGDVSYNIGVVKSNTSLFAPVASSSPIIYVILASIIFKEKIRNSQKIGIILALSGVVLLSI